jgi:3-oxoacyl-[acyl-carrier-protein] synthase-3
VPTSEATTATAEIRDVAYHLPDEIVTNVALSASFPEWTAQEIESKLGIVERRIAGKDETSADLALRAAETLFSGGRHSRESVDFLLFCTQTADYLLPTSACLLQDRLGLRNDIGAIDFNLGCSGYVYGLGLAKGLVETGQAESVLFLTGETYSKVMRIDDKSTRTLFGDAGSATLVTRSEKDHGSIGPFVYGTDGSGWSDLIVRSGGARSPGNPLQDGLGLCMDGPKIFNFSIREVAKSLAHLLEKARLTIEQVDLFVFHQANKYMLDFLQRKCGLPKDKFYLHFAHSGNTVSGTIPIALHHALLEKRIKPGDVVVLLGFGVGLSWGGCVVRF